MDNIDKLKAIQTILKVKADGKFGPISKAALRGASDDQEKQIQTILGVTVDGMFGRLSKAALLLLTFPPRTDAVKAEHAAAGIVLASSFADPGDVIAFRKCKSHGNSDKFCFGVGDNAIGYGGLDTATTITAMAALSHDTLVKKWGSMSNAHKKPIKVTYKGIVVTGIIGDVMSPGLRATIDLNPGFQTRFDVDPPFIIPVTWQWAE